MAEDFSKPHCGDFVKYTIDEHSGQIAFGAVADFEPGKNQTKVDDDPFDTNKPDKGIWVDASQITEIQWPDPWDSLRGAMFEDFKAGKNVERLDRETGHHNRDMDECVRPLVQSEGGDFTGEVTWD